MQGGDLEQKAKPGAITALSHLGYVAFRLHSEASSEGQIRKLAEGKSFTSLLSSQPLCLWPRNQSKQLTSCWHPSVYYKPLAWLQGAEIQGDHRGQSSGVLMLGSWNVLPGTWAGLQMDNSATAVAEITTLLVQSASPSLKLREMHGRECCS